MERCSHKDRETLHNDHEFCMKCYLKRTSNFLTKDCDQCKQILIGIKKNKMTCMFYHQDYNNPIYLCPNHILCKMCVNIGANLKLSCTECNTRMKKKALCFQHAKLINKNDAILNISCTKNHTYCFESYFEYLTSSNFPLTCCNKIFEIPENSYDCSICRKKGPYTKKQICPLHFYCIFCLNQLKKPENSISISAKNFCNTCTIYFKTNANDETQCSQDESFPDIDEESLADEINYPYAFFSQKPKPVIKRPVYKEKNYEINSPQRISQMFLIPVQAKSFVIKPDNKFLGAELVPESFMRCLKCQIPGKIMECQHVFCLNCIAENFNMTFNAFVYYVQQGMFQYLVPEKHRLGCLVEDCYNQYCLPFSLFQDAAKIIVMTNYPIYYNEQFLTFYGPFFEGFPMEFKNCPTCRKNFGYYPHDCSCLYCGTRYC